MTAASQTPAPLLQLSGVEMAFGGLMALNHPDFDLPAGVIKTVIGPNGAGKSTLFNVITGFLKPARGRVLLEGRSLLGLKPHRIAACGITRTFQNVELVRGMTVLENVMLGCQVQVRPTFWGAGLRLPGARRKERRMQEKAVEILHFIGLAKKYNYPSGDLPLGEQKLLEIGRALATGPRLMCLDEPAAGLNETETHVAASLIRAIREKGITVLLVEHDMKLVMEISDEIVVLNYGQKIAEGTPEQIQQDQRVIEAYLGKEDTHAAR